MHPFRYLHLPAAVRASVTADRATSTPASSEGHAADVIRALQEARGALAKYDAAEIARRVGAVGARLLDPGDVLRREASHRLPTETGLSGPVCDGIIEGMARDWTPERLDRLLAAEFRDPGVLDGFRAGPEGSRLHATGGRLAFHLGAGNIPGVGTTSIIRSLLVKCPVLLKPGRTDLALPEIFARGLEEVDPELAQALAVVYWPRGGGGLLEEQLLREADRVVVYGGTAVVRELRGRIPATTPLVAYHHRISTGAVGVEHLRSGDAADAVAAQAARAMAVLDQRGCVSPQIIWVEEGGLISPAGWSERLARELESIEHTLPSPRLSEREASELHQLRGTLELESAAGAAGKLFVGSEGRWGVFFDTEPGTAWSPIGRSARVRPVESLEQLARVLAPYRRVLQTLALATAADRRNRLAHSLAATGVSRITDFEAQPWPPPWWHHDGEGPLTALVRWVELEPDSTD